MKHHQVGQKKMDCFYLKRLMKQGTKVELKILGNLQRGHGVLTLQLTQD
jgi:hypothetical protein